jgi:putative aminopeptidase FrvX
MIVPPILEPVLSRDALVELLKRVLVAHAPRGGCTLDGSIGDVIAVVADEHDIGQFFTRDYHNTGNSLFVFGADKPQPDILVVAHMDRPSFRVKSVETGEIFPVCALRVPVGYTCAAKALRYDHEQVSLIVASRGQFANDPDGLRYRVAEGDLHWYDTIVMDAEPQFIDGMVIATGLDNGLGVMTAFGLALDLRARQPDLQAANRQIMIALTDEEEGNPDSFFGHGAARLAQLVRPVIGVIVCDAHTAGDGMIPKIGAGASHGVISGMGRGAVVAPDRVRLAVETANAINTRRPHTVQLNTGYLSRSDDMGLSRAMRVLGMIGTPMLNPHTVEEQASLSDLEATLVWLSAFMSAL